MGVEAMLVAKEDGDGASRSREPMFSGQVDVTVRSVTIEGVSRV